ncbi:hypothetical protein SAMN05216474_0066 [Lishizhenia tianjinensis]|uniref:Uncharacterized protein n=1 Tax=Lishizhenia tianjinensis TaxID=477690 RepID=A0A1I6XBK8_9FLAO|nr:hypothetical protein [Lishizhenia tianjinensis]SFT35501.1 hypothetical protein SAMN05216474_0066 [Lishizhenia tianjinensis]
MNKRDIVFLTEFESKDMTNLLKRDIEKSFSKDEFKVHVLLWYKGKKLPEDLSNTLDTQYLTGASFSMFGNLDAKALPGEWGNSPFALVSCQTKNNKKLEKIIAAYKSEYKLVRSGVDSAASNVVITDEEQDISKYLEKSNKYINKFK